MLYCLSYQGSILDTILKIRDITLSTKVHLIKALTVKRLSTMWETQVRSLGWEDPLEKAMAIHSSTLAWKIPWTEEPDGLHPWGRQESDMTEATEHAHIHMYINTYMHTHIHIFTSMYINF